MKAMREQTIDIRPQRHLSLAKTFRLVTGGIQHRFLRSLLTVCVGLLAVAFFTTILLDNLFIRRIGDRVAVDIRAAREASSTMAFLTAPPSTREWIDTLAVAEPERLAECARVSGIPETRLRALAAFGATYTRYLAFFGGMNVGKRMILVKKNKDGDIFRFLAARENWLEFLEAMKPLRSLKLPEDAPKFRDFLDAYDTSWVQLEEFSVAWRAALARFDARTRKRTGEIDLARWLSEAPPGEAETWRRDAEAAGFSLPEFRLARLREELQAERLRREIEEALGTPEAKTAWRRIFQDNVSLDEKMDRLGDARVGALLHGRYAQAQRLDVQRRLRRERQLDDLERKVATRQEAKSGGVLSGRQAFLMAIAFVVCVVGIANAMLMAITERFREIATMKCLGATDGFILTQFVVEAGLQGLAGGVVGAAIGFILAILKNGLIFGDYLFGTFPIFASVLCGLISVFLGALLAVLASLGPAYAASRMPPMEAMRIE